MISVNLRYILFISGVLSILNMTIYCISDAGVNLAQTVIPILTYFINASSKGLLTIP